MKWVLLLALMLLAAPSHAALVLIGAGHQCAVGDTLVLPIKTAYMGMAKFNALRAGLTYHPQALRMIRAEVAPAFHDACANRFASFKPGAGIVCLQASLLCSDKFVGAGEVFRVYFIALAPGITDVGFADCPNSGPTQLMRAGFDVPTKMRTAHILVTEK